MPFILPYFHIGQFSTGSPFEDTIYDMRRVPKKNISPVVSDIHHTKTAAPPPPPPKKRSFADHEGVTRFFKGDEKSSKATHGAMPPLPNRIIVKILFVFAAAGVAAVCGVLFIRAHVIYSANTGVSKIQDAVSGLRSLNFDDVNQALQGAKDSFQSAGSPGIESIIPLVGHFVPVVKNAATVFKDMQEVIGLSLTGVNELHKLLSQGVDDMLGKRGANVIESLEALNGTVKAVQDKINEIHSLGQGMQGPGGSLADTLTLGVQLSQSSKFLNAFTEWMKSDTPHHIALFFQNTSELRPGGGFLGSFADVTIHKGQIENVEVLDINQIDRTALKNIVPPVPLQAIVKNWRSADANWFFDFPKSAEKTLSLMEGTEFYASRGEKFDGAIAVTPAIVSDVLSFTGPVAIDGKEINADNLIYEVQRDVQQSQDAHQENAKAIIARLVPLMFQGLSSTSADTSKFWVEHIPTWVQNKDVLAYFRDETFQSFVLQTGSSGSAFKIPSNFNGDYLALSEANIGGQKTDLVLAKKITYRAQLSIDGTISKRVSVAYSHEGNDQADWWYQEPFKGYIMMYTLPGSDLVSASGTWPRVVPASVDYAKSGYENDPDIQAEELQTKSDFNFPSVSHFQTNDVDGFGFWMKAAAGSTSTASLEYIGRSALSPADGREYSFVFERQPGWKGAYDIEIASPVGFVWKENSSPIFDYKADSIPGRFTLELTLKKSL
jgi:Protein of unknown function (DUF4012)